MHYHLVTTGAHDERDGIATVDTAAGAEREALRLAMGHGDWNPKRYPGRTWKRGEVAVYLDRDARGSRGPNPRELSIVRCPASDALALDCYLRSIGVPALNLNGEPAEPLAVSSPAAAITRR